MEQGFQKGQDHPGGGVPHPVSGRAVSSHPASGDHSSRQVVSRDAATLRRALAAEIEGLQPCPAGKNSLVALCGLPGTGKSHFAAALAQRISCIVLGSDRLRKALTPRPVYDREEHERVFNAAHELLEALLSEGYRVIFDATNLTERARQPLRDIAERTGASLLLVQFDAPHAVVRRRLARRSQGLASDTYSDADWRIYCRLFPGQEPIAGPHIRVDSSRDIEDTLSKVVRLAGE